MATPINAATLALAGGNNITLSQSANSVTISGANPNPGTMSLYPDNAVPTMSATLYSGSTTTGNQTTVSAWVAPMALPAPLKFNQLRVIGSNSLATASGSRWSYSQGMSIGLYTLNVSSLSMMSSWSNSVGFSNVSAANSTAMSLSLTMGYDGAAIGGTTQHASAGSVLANSISGSKVYPFVQTNNTYSLSQGQYWLVYYASHSTSSANGGILQSIGVNTGSSMTLPPMAAGNSAVNGMSPLQGTVQLVVSTNMPASIQTNNINTGTTSPVWFQFATTQLSQ